MKRIIYIALSIVALVFSSFDANAFHIIGGEITYECLGPGADPNTNRYRMIMFIYRDCNGGGAELDPNAFIGIYSGSGNGPFSLVGIRSPELVGPNEVPQPDIDCLIPPVLCVEEGSYTWEVDLPIIDDDYIFSYQRCCRNSSISNIFNPDRVGATFWTTITAAAQQECNNSPVFNDFPPTVICVNEPLMFDHSAFDSNGDSLVYEFCSPKIGAGLAGGDGTGDPNGCDGVMPIPGCPPPFEDVSFRTPIFTAIQPMGGDPVVAIDPVTGMITGVPLTVGQFVVGVCVKEYRNGELIGELRRDFQFNVEACEATVVAQIQADTELDDKLFSSVFCGQTSVDFINESFLEEQITTYDWEFYDGESLLFTGDTRDITVSFPDTGLYTGLMFVNRNSICEDSAQINVRILPETTADFDFSFDTCVVGPVSFTNLSTTEANDIVSYEWDFNSEGFSSMVDPIFQFPVPGQKGVSLLVTDNNGCTSEMVKSVVWAPAPQTIIVQPNTFLGCEPADITFINQSSPIDETYTFNWDFGDGNTSNDLSPVHRYESSGVYDVSLEIISPANCEVSEVFDRLIRVEPGPIADFDFNPKEITTFNNTVQFTNLSQGERSWFWDFSRKGFSTEENPIFVFQDTGIQEVRLIVTRDNGCQDTITKFIDVIPEVVFHMPNAFTPNDDGSNEEFFGKGILDGMENFNFTIWNRWGERIFETTDPNVGWNGRIMNTGELSPVGSYVYLVTFRGPRGEPYEFKGNANLVR